jgi:SH3 domain-containing protein
MRWCPVARRHRGKNAGMRNPYSMIMRTLASLAVLALLAAACGEDDGNVETAETTTSTAAPDPATTEPAPTTAPAPTSAPTPTPAPTTVPDADLPGESFDAAPAAGRSVAVAGVRHDDALNVRSAPGTDNEIVAELAPTSTDAVATGRARLLPSSIWWEVTTADGIVGWISSKFTAQIGPTTDTTAQLIAELGTTPEAASIADLGRLIAEATDNDPDVPTDIVMSVNADESGDLAEVTFDVIGLGDDAVRGIRLHVFGQPLESGDGFALRTVEATDLCDPVRGPTEPEGICA